jgi:hypothetical protein
MHRRRFGDEVGMDQLPELPAPEASFGAFMFYPVALIPDLTAEQFLLCQWIYQRAFEQAQAVVRPSLPERDLLGVWN